MRFQCTFCSTIIRPAGQESRLACPNCGKRVAVPQDPFETGCVVDDFVIENVIGQGGMATVYLAKQLSMDRPVALKVLSDECFKRDKYRRSFLKEAKAAARLNHPNLIQAMKVGVADGALFYAMEYVHGQTLAARIETQKTLEVNMALNIVQQCAEALHAAWTQEGLVHRDIKPDNIMLAEDGYAKIMDLGIAITFDEADQAEISGTPAYMAPEQFRREQLDCRTDIYSLGATLFHALAGFAPFGGENVPELARKHVFTPLQFPEKELIYLPQRLKRALSKMMAKDPEDRYQDYDELLGDIVALRKRLAPDELQVPGVHTISFSKYRLQEEIKDSPGEVYRKRSSMRRKVAIAKAQSRRREGKINYRPWLVIGGLALAIILLGAGSLLISGSGQAPRAFLRATETYFAALEGVRRPDNDPEALAQAIQELDRILKTFPAKPTDAEQDAWARLHRHRDTLQNERFDLLQERIRRQNAQFEKEYKEFVTKNTDFEQLERKRTQAVEAAEERKRKYLLEYAEFAKKEAELAAREARFEKQKTEFERLAKDLAETRSRMTQGLRYSLQWRLIDYCRSFRFKDAEKLVAINSRTDALLKDWAARKVKELANAEKVYRSVYNSGAALKGMRTARGKILFISRLDVRLAVTRGKITTVEESTLNKLDPEDFLALAEKNWATRGRPRLAGDAEGSFAAARLDYAICTGEFALAQKLAKRENTPQQESELETLIQGCFHQMVSNILAYLRSGNRKLAVARAKYFKARYGSMAAYKAVEGELLEAFK